MNLQMITTMRQIFKKTGFKTRFFAVFIFNFLFLKKVLKNLLYFDKIKKNSKRSIYEKDRRNKK